MSDVPAPHPKKTTIALDAMGGDHGIDAVIPGAARVLKNKNDIHFLLYGDKHYIEKRLSDFPALRNNSTIIHTDKTIGSDDKPSRALRNSADTSMRMAIEAVNSGQADAVVSSGNTGALMALAKLVLKSLPDINRPAIASVFPAKNGSTIMLDLGANLIVDGETLAQFAVLGAVFARSKNILNPSIGLLNVGTENAKGPEHVRNAHAILANVEIPGRYYGFVEGNDINKGTVDVVVSDGYAGNIALKTAEGAGSFMGGELRRSMTGDPLSKLGAFIASFALNRLKKQFDPRLYNGGVFLGLNGLCVKSHGGADEIAFASAVRLAYDLAKHDYIGKVKDDIHYLMSQDSFLSPGV